MRSEKRRRMTRTSDHPWDRNYSWWVGCWLDRRLDRSSTWRKKTRCLAHQHCQARHTALTEAAVAALAGVLAPTAGNVGVVGRIAGCAARSIA